MIKVALGAGLRFGELIALTWDAVDFKRGELIIKQAFAEGVLGSTKSNKIRRIPMTASVHNTLNEIENINGYVFADINGEHLDQHISLSKLHKICRKAGLRKIGWHCLRHTFASHLAQAGANLVAIQNLLGHSDIRTTMRYAHINGTVLREAINNLNKNEVKREYGNSCHNSVTVPISQHEKANCSIHLVA